MINITSTLWWTEGVYFETGNGTEKFITNKITFNNEPLNSPHSPGCFAEQGYNFISIAWLEAGNTIYTGYVDQHYKVNNVIKSVGKTAVSPAILEPFGPTIAYSGDTPNSMLTFALENMETHFGLTTNFPPALCIRGGTTYMAWTEPKTNRINLGTIIYD